MVYIFLLTHKHTNDSVDSNLPNILTNILALRDEYERTDFQVVVKAWQAECEKRKKIKKKPTKKPTITQTTIQKFDQQS